VFRFLFACLLAWTTVAAGAHLNADEAAVKFIWNVPGAIALVDAAVSAPPLAHVKILRIGGQLPEDRGYPLE
jgi:hypothetical protein